MQQLNLDLPTLPLQLTHMGWTAHFREHDGENGEIVYTLTTPNGDPYSESFTGLPMSKLKQAKQDAKEAIAVMEAAPPFVMMPQPSKRGIALNNTPTEERHGHVAIIQRSHSLSIQTSRKSNEQYTPDLILELAIAVMGVIDLDPCSNSHEFPNVPARRHYTKDDDGLAHDWQGRVWVNPPYSDTSKWVDKLIGEHEAGNVVEAIALVKSATDTRWYQKLDDYPCCHWNGRLKFKNPGNKNNTAPFPSALFYFGSNFTRFKKVFQQYGRVKLGMKMLSEFYRITDLRC